MRHKFELTFLEVSAKNKELFFFQILTVLRSQENGRCEGFFNGRMEGPNPTKTYGIRIKMGGGDVEKKV